MILSRYISASAVVTTGGTRLGMMMARPKWRALSGRTAASIAPSRRCRCQSSGLRIVRVVDMTCHYPKLLSDAIHGIPRNGECRDDIRPIGGGLFGRLLRTHVIRVDPGDDIWLLHGITTERLTQFLIENDLNKGSGLVFHLCLDRRIEGMVSSSMEVTETPFSPQPSATLA